MPISATLRATSSGPRSIRTPRASSVSAPPDSDDAARLPCLTTGTPAAAQTMAAMVDRLTVLAPSPPVPTTSTVSVPILSVGTLRACFSIMSASSLTSAAVGRFIFIATPNAAICAGVAALVMIWSIAQPASPVARCCPSVRRPSIRGHVGDGADGPEGIDEGDEGDSLTGPIFPCRRPPPTPGRRPPGRHRESNASPGGVRQLQSVILLLVTSAVGTSGTAITSRIHSLNRPNMVSVGTIVWLSSELMFFAGLFAMYFTARAQAAGDWPPAPTELNLALAVPVTLVLIASSFTCQMGVFAAERGDVFGLRRWYTLTL